MAVEVAKGIQNHPHLKLGAVLGSGQKDVRTLTLDEFIKKDAVQAPASWDFDKSRKPFTPHMWGNDSYGDCECAGVANYLVRLERVETKQTPPVTDDDVIARYKKMTGCQSPGDNNDTGLNTVDNLNSWRAGWTLVKEWKPGVESARTYNIDAYGMVNHKDPHQTRLAAYLFHGILIGADLPITAQAQFENGQPWDVVAGAGSSSDAGSWGGHCMYGKAYDPNHMKLLTWEKEVIVTNAWWDAYVSESFCVIDSLDTWKKNNHAFDVNALLAEMSSVGIAVTQ